MTFNRYIITSFLSHGLLIALLSMITFNSNRTFSIFDVDIVGPLESEQRPPVKTAPPAVVPPAVRPAPQTQEITKIQPDKKAKPDTLYGDAISISPAKSKDEQKPGPGIPASPPEEKGIVIPLPETGEQGTVPDGKEAPDKVPPSVLFDEKTIEKFALKGPPQDKGLTFDTSEFKHRGYMRMLKEKIEGIWQYPREAAKRGISGDLYIKFSIKKDGKLGNVELMRTSGYEDLDRAAIRALKDGEPYWPLPADWDKDFLEITGHFIYVYGSAIVM